MDYYGSLPVGGQGGQTRQPGAGVPRPAPLVRAHRHPGGGRRPCLETAASELVPTVSFPGPVANRRALVPRRSPARDARVGQGSPRPRRRLADAASLRDEQQLLQAPSPGHHLAAVYGTVTGQRRALVLAGEVTMSRQDQADFLASAEHGIPGSVPSGFQAVDPGELGGSMRCGMSATARQQSRCASKWSTAGSGRLTLMEATPRRPASAGASRRPSPRKSSHQRPTRRWPNRGRGRWRRSPRAPGRASAPSGRRPPRAGWSRRRSPGHSRSKVSSTQV